MKRLTQGRLILTLAIALAMLLLSGLGIAGVIREEIKKLDEEKTTLTAERDRLKKIEDSRSDYENQTAKFSEAFDEITAHYPADITQNNQLLFLKGIEDEFGIRIASASYTEPEAIYRFQYLAPGNDESYSLVRSTVQFPMRISYDEWKRFITFIEETDGRDVIETVMADYDATESLVDAEVTISQYAITGDDRRDEELTTEVETGTDNIFSSPARLITMEEEYGDEPIEGPPVPHVNPVFYSDEPEALTPEETEGTGDGEMTGDGGDEAPDESGEGGETEEGDAEEGDAASEGNTAKGGPTGIRSSIR